MNFNNLVYYFHSLNLKQKACNLIWNVLYGAQRRKTEPERGGGGVSNFLDWGDPESMCGGQAIEVDRKVGAFKTDMQEKIIINIL